MCECADHGRHDMIISAADDDSWTVGQWLARGLTAMQHRGVRVLIWHTKDWFKPLAVSEPSAGEIEDDMPF